MIINSTLCYIRQNGSYLMLHRIKKKNDINKDKWIGIGGKFESGESPYDCILREAMEETSLELIDPTYRGVVTFVADDNYTELMHLFTCEKFSGDLSDCNEGTLEWVKIDDVPKLPIWEGDKIFLRLISGDAPFFSLKLVYKGESLIEAVLDGKRMEI